MRPARDAAATLLRSAASEAAANSGVVRVTASEIIDCEVLPPILARYCADHPGVAIELAVTNRDEDLARGDADIAVRMIRPTQSGLLARRIGAVRIRLYAHRDYIARFGEPRSLADLPRHGVIGFDRDNRAFRGAGEFARGLTREHFGFRCDNDAAQLAALRAGVGIGGCQDAIARRTSELVPVLPNAFQHSLEIWLAMHRDLKSTRRVRLLFDRLAVGLADYVKGRADERRTARIGRGDPYLSFSLALAPETTAKSRSRVDRGDVDVTERASLLPPTVTGFAAKSAIAALRKHNIASQPLLRRAGLSEHAFDNPRNRVSAAGQVKFLEYAADAMRDTAFGLHLAEQANPREAGLLFYVVSAARSLGESLALFARYCQIVNESLRLKLVRRAEGVIVEINYVGISRQGMRQNPEFGIAVRRQGFAGDYRSRHPTDPSGLRPRSHCGCARIRALLRLSRRVRRAVRSTGVLQ